MGEWQVERPLLELVGTPNVEGNRSTAVNAFDVVETPPR